MKFEGKCVSCSGLGSYLDSRGNCSCDENLSILTLSRDQCISCRGEGIQLYDENSCECQSGYLMHPNREECTKCIGPGARLDENGFCVCDGTRMKLTK